MLFSVHFFSIKVLGGYIDVMAVAVGTKERDDDDFNGDDGNDEAVTTFTQVFDIFTDFFGWYQ